MVSDAHGDFEWLPDWCYTEKTTNNDLLILLGDSALRFEGSTNSRELYRKNLVSQCPITIVALRGNHDRPFTVDNECHKTECPLISGELWHDDNYPNIWYFDDFGEYVIKDKTFLVAGGAYSVDKEWRRLMHWTWYEDEQLTAKQWWTLFSLATGNHYDYVLTHTCPYSWRPADLFLPSIDQSKVDSTTEKFLENLKNHIQFSNWYFGHFHQNRIIDYDKGHVEMLMEKIIEVK